VCVLYYRLCFAITSNLVFFLSIIDHILFIFFFAKKVIHNRVFSGSSECIIIQFSPQMKELEQFHKFFQPFSSF